MSSKSDANRWHEEFCGRKADLNILKDAWGRVSGSKTGHQEIVILEAEIGFGKTRLMQEFYQWLSTNCDPDNYWPNCISTENRKTLDPTSSVTGNYGPMSGKKIPFLWWGIVLSDTGNSAIAARSALSAAAPQLQFHLAHLESYIRELKGNKEIAEILTKTGLGWLISVANILTVGQYGLAKDLAGNILDTGFAAKETHKQYNESRKPKLSASDSIVSLLELFVNKTDTASKKEGFIGLVSKQAIPVILVIDDAQFSEAQPDLVELVNNILSQAKTSNWSILLVCTTWQTEWRVKGSTKAKSNYSLSDLLKIPPSGWQYQERTLKRIPDLSAAISRALPGLTSDQILKFQDRCDGNPLYMHDLILHFENAPGLFDNFDVTSTLNKNGEAELEECEKLDYETFVYKRIGKLPSEARRVLALSSMQDVFFLKNLTITIAENLGDTEVDENLRKLEFPHSFIESIGNSAAAFNERTYHRQSLAQLSNCYSPEEIEKAKHLLEEGIVLLYLTFIKVVVEPSEGHMFFLKLISNLLKSSDDTEKQTYAAFASSEIGYYYLSIRSNRNAIAAFDQGIAIFKALKENLEEQISPPQLHGLAVAHMNKGVALNDLGDTESALVNYDQADAILLGLNKVFGEKTPPSTLNDLALVQVNRGVLLNDAGDTAGAIAAYGKAITTLEALAKEHGTQAPESLHTELANTQRNMGLSLLDAGNYKDAISAFDQAITILESLHEKFGKEAPPSLLISLFYAQINRGDILKKSGDDAGAFAAYEQVFDTLETMVEELGEKIRLSFFNDLGNVQMKKGELLVNDGQEGLAKECFEDALSMWNILKENLDKDFPPSWEDSMTRAQKLLRETD